MEVPVKIHDDSGMPRSIPNHARPVQGSRPDPNSDSQTIRRAGQDRVELSDRARALLVAKEALSQTPPVRAEKVEALKQMVRDGAYQVPAEKVAARMLGEGLFA
jgi:negative regulator of flagellin synthesis FlgM